MKLNDLKDQNVSGDIMQMTNKQCMRYLSVHLQEIVRASVVKIPKISLVPM